MGEKRSSTFKLREFAADPARQFFLEYRRATLGFTSLVRPQIPESRWALRSVSGMLCVMQKPTRHRFWIGPAAIMVPRHRLRLRWSGQLLVSMGCVGNIPALRKVRVERL